jgi:hypothetical protein
MLADTRARTFQKRVRKEPLASATRLSLLWLVAWGLEEMIYEAGVEV